MNRRTSAYWAYVKAEGDKRTPFPPDVLDGIGRRIGMSVRASAARITTETKNERDAA